MEPDDRIVINNNTDIFNFMLTNARSLTPKIDSLLNVFDAHQLDFALVTESWLKDGSVLDGDVIDLEYGTGLKILYKNRPTRRRNVRQVGGGVSIISRRATCNFRERRIAGNTYELVAATGKVGRLQQTVAVFCVYVEPRMKAAELDKLRDLLAGEILALKTASSNPLIFLGGDMNRRDFAPIFDAFHDFTQVNHAPTRQGACLDILFSNCPGLQYCNWPPLQSKEGVGSDHDCIIFRADVPRQRNFTWVKKTSRKYTDNGARAFAAEFGATDWGSFLAPGSGPSAMVARFQDRVSELTDRHFPVKTSRRRSNEPEWVTQGIRKASKAKRRIFRREGKSQRWKATHDRLTRLLEESKSGFVNRMKEKGTRSYFTAIKALSSCDPPSTFEVTDLVPGKSPNEAANLAAEYFTTITDQFRALDNQRSDAPLREEVSLDADQDQEIQET